MSFNLLPLYLSKLQAHNYVGQSWRDSSVFCVGFHFKASGILKHYANKMQMVKRKYPDIMLASQYK